MLIFIMELNNKNCIWYNNVILLLKKQQLQIQQKITENDFKQY